VPNGVLAELAIMRGCDMEQQRIREVMARKLGDDELDSRGEMEKPIPEEASCPKRTRASVEARRLGIAVLSAAMWGDS
jgi:hypothetical protein